MINNKKVFSITLARGGSKSVLNKNLQKVNNKSLLERAINCSKNCNLIDYCYVSSDSDDILNESIKFGATPIKRPEQFSSDTATSAGAIKHWLDTLEEKPDYIVEIMCTSPFRTAIDVGNCIIKLDSTKADSVVSVTRIWDHHPSRLKYIKEDILMDFYPEIKESRRQDLTPEAYVRNGSIYTFTYDSFLRTNSRYGGIVRPYIMPENRSINIDGEMELLLAQFMGEKYGL